MIQLLELEGFALENETNLTALIHLIKMVSEKSCKVASVHVPESYKEAHNLDKEPFYVKSAEGLTLFRVKIHLCGIKFKPKSNPYREYKFGIYTVEYDAILLTRA